MKELKDKSPEELDAMIKEAGESLGELKASAERISGLATEADVAVRPMTLEERETLIREVELWIKISQLARHWADIGRTKGEIGKEIELKKAEIVRRLTGDVEATRERSGRPMFPAKCSECGNPCEVSFEPDPNRSVYCRGCLEKRRTQRTQPQQKGRTRQERQMYPVAPGTVCVECKTPIEQMPFPVWPEWVPRCSACYEASRAGRGVPTATETSFDKGYNQKMAELQKREDDLRQREATLAGGGPIPEASGRLSKKKLHKQTREAKRWQPGPDEE